MSGKLSILTSKQIKERDKKRLAYICSLTPRNLLYIFCFHAQISAVSKIFQKNVLSKT